MREEFEERVSHEGPIVFEHFQVLQDWPRNPRGRTGISERGLLGCWGPNHAVDPIVTRWSPGRPEVLQMCAMKRRDTGQWAIPGEMMGACPGDGAPSHEHTALRRDGSHLRS